MTYSVCYRRNQHDLWADLEANIAQLENIY